MHSSEKAAWGMMAVETQTMPWLRLNSYSRAKRIKQVNGVDSDIMWTTGWCYHSSCGCSGMNNERKGKGDIGNTG